MPANMTSWKEPYEQQSRWLVRNLRPGYGSREGILRERIRRRACEACRYRPRDVGVSAAARAAWRTGGSRSDARLSLRRKQRHPVLHVRRLRRRSGEGRAIGWEDPKREVLHRPIRLYRARRRYGGQHDRPPLAALAPGRAW